MKRKRIPYSLEMYRPLLSQYFRTDGDINYIAKMLNVNEQTVYSFFKRIDEYENQKKYDNYIKVIKRISNYNKRVYQDIIDISQYKYHKKLYKTHNFFLRNQGDAEYIAIKTDTTTSNVSCFLKRFLKSEGDVYHVSSSTKTYPMLENMIIISNRNKKELYGRSVKT